MLLKTTLYISVLPLGLLAQFDVIYLDIYSISAA